MTSEQYRKWQQRIDADFPRGLLATWSDEKGDMGGPVHVYLCPRVEVTGFSGLDPVVMLPVPDFEKVVQPGAIASYRVIQDAPAKVVQVRFADGRRMDWGDGLTDKQAERVAEDREHNIKLSEEAGESAWATSPE